MTANIYRLAWRDPLLGMVHLPGGSIRIRAGFGSGLTRRAGDGTGSIWAICDRGPNMKLRTAVDRYGASALAASKDRAGAKLMPRLDLGPALAELEIVGDQVRLLRTLRLRTFAGREISGLPLPGGEHEWQEPVFGLDGEELGTDSAGADTEGVAAAKDGGFWIGDEYGPSLLRLDSEGRVLVRLVPAGREAALEGCGYPVDGILPPIAARRQINRGFEALALSPDERALWLAFQSPLAHPDAAAHRRARHIRFWRLDAATGRVAAQFLYRLDLPDSFRRDCAKGHFDGSDVKVSEIAVTSSGSLLVLERGSETTKIYLVAVAEDRALPASSLDLEARPTVEEMSAEASPDLPVLDKTLLFSSDDSPEVSPDLEGMVMLSDRELLLVSDNDFGMEGAETSFWKLVLSEPIP